MNRIRQLERYRKRKYIETQREIYRQLVISMRPKIDFPNTKVDDFRKNVLRISMMSNTR